jgi:GTP-binding protein
MKILNAEWLATAAAPDGFPHPGVSEVAFLGRSNVGKSSLLNALVQRKKLARISSAPGKTRLIHFYRVERPDLEINLVDLPGYGYAKVSKVERKRWQGLVESYLEGRPTLRAAVLLQDLRRDLSEDETLLIDWLEEREVPIVLAITKVDKLKPMRRKARLNELKKSIGLSKSRVIATSAEKRIGIDDLWRAIDAAGLRDS